MDGRDGLQWLGRDASELEGLMELTRRFCESYDGREREGLRAFWMKKVEFRDRRCCPYASG